MQLQYSVSELAERVNEWCSRHDISPLHARVGEQVTVRNIRYYQGLGIVDRPNNASGKGFNEKHRLQLVAIRLLQAKGLPLDRIQQLLSDRNEEDLREVERRGLVELAPSAAMASGFTRNREWTLTTLDADALLLTRSGRDLTPSQKQRILDVLRAPQQHAEQPTELEDFFRPEID